MFTWRGLGVALLALASQSSAEGNLPADHYLWGEKGIPTSPIEPRKAPTDKRSLACLLGNTNLARNCWSSGYTVATDFDQSWPTTGVTKSYTLIATNGTCDPDGNGARECLLFNEQYPGPTITANWGDTISVTVINDMQHNGTSVHWHGMRQLNTNGMDGTNGMNPIILAETNEADLERYHGMSHCSRATENLYFPCYTIRNLLVWCYTCSFCPAANLSLQKGTIAISRPSMVMV